MPSRGILCPYVVTKRQAEQVVFEEIRRGLDAVVVNPAFMLGPWDWKPSSGRMLLHVARGWALFAPLGTNSYCDVRDVAGAILTSLRLGGSGRRYILAGETWSYFRAWRKFAEITGGSPPIIPLGPMARWAAGRCGDLWTRLTHREPDVNSAATALSGQRRSFTSQRARDELGYRPRPMQHAAAAAWEWFQENDYA